MNITFQDLKMETEAKKKTKTDGILGMAYLSKLAGTANTSITNRIQEIQEKISGVEVTIEEIDTSSKKMPGLKRS